MDTLSTLENEITAMIEDAQSIKTDTTIIDISKLQQREREILRLNELLKKLRAVTNRTQSNIHELKIHHESDIKKFSCALSNLAPSIAPAVTPAPISHPAPISPHINYSIKKTIQPPKQFMEVSGPTSSAEIPKSTEKGWNYVTRGGKKAPIRTPDESPVSQTTPRTTQYTKVYITQHYFLHAIKVNNFDELKNMKDGILYYVVDNEHFAIKIAGMLLHGNIGKIYTQVSDPVKIKNCRHGGSCPKHDSDCNYYHNPLVTPGGKDTRNFIATSWLYANPTHPHKHKTKARRFGDRSNIDTDMTQLSAEEGERFFDQAMHDLLCTMLLHKYRKFGDELIQNA